MIFFRPTCKFCLVGRELNPGEIVGPEERAEAKEKERRPRANWPVVTASGWLPTRLAPDTPETRWMPKTRRSGGQNSRRSRYGPYACSR
jgi:hypothetical protein